MTKVNDWFKVLTRQITPQIMSIVSSPKYYFPKAVGAGFKNQLYVQRGEKHEFYFSEKEWANFSQAVANLMHQNSDFFAKHAKACLFSGDSLKYVTAEMKNVSKKTSNETLLNLYENYLKKLEEFYLFLWTPHVVEKYLEQTIKEELSAELQRQSRIRLFDSYFGIISTKVKRNLAEKEEIELLKISALLNRRGHFDTEVLHRVTNHAQKWCWLPFYSLDMQLWQINYFSERIKKLKTTAAGELIGQERLQENRLQNLSRVKRELSNNRRLIALINALQEYLFLRTDRTDTLRLIQYNIKSFLEESARRIELDYGEIIFLTPEELANSLKNHEKPSTRKIRERARHFLIITKGNGPIKIVSSTAEIEQMLKAELREAITAQEGKQIILKGNGVYPEVVEGNVKLIHNVSDASRMRKGDVLVAVMTTPEMTEIYSKASAIVTDEGGITCHAAIISRELKIPAVVGTGEATTLLADGMRVRVDSRKGIVYKL